MSHFIEQNYNEVVRVYTDGILSKTKLDFKNLNNRKLENLGIGVELGQMKYEVTIITRYQ